MFQLFLKMAACTASLVLALSVEGQDLPNLPQKKTVFDPKVRRRAEKGQKSLGASWAQYLKSNPWKSSDNKAVAPQMHVLLAPDVEKSLEANLPFPQRQSFARSTKAEYIEPEVLRSHEGVLSVTLEGAHAHNQIGTDPVYLRAFNGKLVGPTLRLKPGDQLRLTLKNKMPGQRWQPNMMNTLNSFNTMNMHFHGLHVSPNGISDNVLIQVGPDETQEYVVDIPTNHTTGTYWYHPHRHGSTAGDVASGMSGALIIEAREGEPGLDHIPEIKAAKDRVMVLNQIPYLYKNTVVDPPNSPKSFDLPEGLVEEEFQQYIFGPGDWGALGRYTTINGVQLPVIRMRPGQLERWRFVDSGQREMIKLRLIPNPAVPATGLPPINFQEIAVDGLALGKMIETPMIELWPGYRSDVLVQAPMSRGEYLLIDDVSPASATIGGQDKPLNYVARIVIEGGPDPMKLPPSDSMAALRLPSITDAEITGQQQANYGILLVGQNAVFTIDGKSFDMETARTLKLNDVDEWTIRSINDVGPVTHPFHIHVNPFEVTSIMAPDGANSGTLIELLKNGPVWRDTVKIPGNGIVKMRTRYTDFIGTFVQHCHILDHEDQGMMQLIDIVDPTNNAAAANVSVVPTIRSFAPDFRLSDAFGTVTSLDANQGKPVVVFFFKGHGCLHCAQQVQAFTENHDAFQHRGVRVIGVTSDDVNTLKNALESSPCPFTILSDPQGIAFAKYGCLSESGLRHGTFCIDKKQQICWGTVGESPYLSVKDLLEQIEPVTALFTDESTDPAQFSGGLERPVSAKTPSKPVN